MKAQVKANIYINKHPSFPWEGVLDLKSSSKADIQKQIFHIAQQYIYTLCPYASSIIIEDLEVQYLFDMGV